MVGCAHHRAAPLGRRCRRHTDHWQRHHATTIVLIGSFLVPVTGVVWYLDHDPSPALSLRRITAAFIIAGTLGVLAASLLEYYFVGTGVLANVEVGLVEELVKTLLVVAVAWGIHSFHTRDGMVLGAIASR